MGGGGKWRAADPQGEREPGCGSEMFTSPPASQERLFLLQPQVTGPLWVTRDVILAAECSGLNSVPQKDLLGILAVNISECDLL